MLQINLNSYDKTMNFLFIIGTLVVAAFIWLMTLQMKRLRRKMLFLAPFPANWQRIIEQNVSLYHRMPETLRKELHGHMNIFLKEKNFVGCEELKINDEIRVIIAAQACVLLLNRKTDYYPGLKTIMVYPGDYVAEEIQSNGFVHSVNKEVRMGESWGQGPVVLSWDAVKHGASEFSQKGNVVLHEFAHQLDQENQQSEGVPILEDSSQYEDWGKTLSREFELLNNKVITDEETVLDDYGATSPAEFFAVLSETFFERPNELKADHLELYEAVKNYYKLDPSQWHGSH